jgi:hypothetical protein
MWTPYKGSSGSRGCLTVSVNGVWAGVNNIWEQKKLEAKQLLENRADSHKSLF